MTPSDTEGRPTGLRLFHFQYSRNPLRCQAMTVPGLRMTNADRQPPRILRAIPLGIDPRDSSAADGHGWSARAPRADVGGQESQRAALLEFEGLENSERMIVSVSPKSYSDGCLNSTSSVRTEFLVRTAPIRRRSMLNVARSYVRSTIGSIVVGS